MKTNPRRKGMHSFITSLIFVVTCLGIQSASAFNNNGGGRYQLLISPQACEARIASHDIYIRRSTFAQIINARNSDLTLVCPMPRTWQSDVSGGCEQSFQVAAFIRLRPAVSTRPALMRFAMASPTGDHSPAGYKTDVSLSIADTGWDTTTRYTPGTQLFAQIACEQPSQTQTTLINLDAEQFLPSVTITLPAGAQLRGFLTSGGEN